MNVVIIFTDQQRKSALGKVNPQYITPNLDRLANEGVLFYNGYTSNPVCTAARVCLLSGKHSSITGRYGNGKGIRDCDLQLAEVMKAAGYNTAYVGKYHLDGGGNNPVPKGQRKGIDRLMAYQCYNGFRPDPPHNNAVVFFDENDKKYRYDYHRTDVTTDLSLNYLEDLTADAKPFFMLVNYQAPHYPEQPSDQYYKLYENTTFTLPADYEEIDPYTQTFSPPSAKPIENCPDYQRYGNNIQEYLRCYAGMCTQIDTGVGKIIDLLKAKAVYDDTVIIYTSDHGDMQGSKGQKNKQLPYEGSAGVPMIIKYPNGRVNEFSDELISIIDIFNTCADIAGYQHNEDVASISVLPYLQRKVETTHDFVISEGGQNFKDNWKMIRDKRYKLITKYDYTPTELYDMQSDPNETNNLIESMAMQTVIAKLLDQLKAETIIYKEA
ncbi:sulfatase [Candidatus Epulonipiscium viviparus]|uniref:sulfatase family protein n=1 Tax=Candidatus Epulonipiscium viviparus TaxID=420336 RepID=UPI0027380F89|nr:sulfatase-like hydrolase/transferase [Candidatus Epulopiscium viviparus]